MCIRDSYQTHLPPEYDGVTGYGLYADGVKQMDDHVGELLDLLEELGVADDTFVMFSTDNVLGHEGNRDLVNRSLCADIERRGMHSEPDGFHRQRDRSLP